MRSWLGRKGDRYLDKKGPELWLHSDFQSFFVCVKIVQGYRDIFFAVVRLVHEDLNGT